MTRLLISIIVLLLTSMAAIAQTVIVRSGDHEGFTRLAMQLPGKVGWSVSQSRRKLAVKIDAPEIQFDTSQVFDRISRRRLRNLIQEGLGADLVLTLGCPCSIESFTQPSDILVIDIKDVVGEQAIFQRRESALINRNLYRFPHQVSLEHQGKFGSQKLVFPEMVTHRPENKLPEAIFDEHKYDGSVRLNNSISASEERLLAQIGRATEQGLLDMQTRSDKLRLDHVTVGVRDNANDQERHIPGWESLPVSLAATTILDRGMVPTPEEINFTCIASEKFALHRWGGGQSFSTEINYWRSRLFGEFDRIDVGIALDLARAYLHFGFGAEAMQVLQLGGGADESYLILAAIAQILDHGELPAGNPFEGQQGCDGDAAFWSVIASGAVPEGTNTAAVQRGISRLPAHLRHQLGPQVSQKFAEAGDIQMATSILHAVERTEVEPGFGIELARAAIARLGGDTETTERELLKSVELSSEHSARALAEFVMGRFEERRAISPEVPNLVAAYAFEYRNAEAGSEMRHALVLALALDSQFHDAFAILSDVGTLDGEIARQTALVPLLSMLSERADDVTFLQYALSATAGNIYPNLPTKANEKVANRLLDLGFAEQAEVWIPERGNLPASYSNHLLRAKVALARKLPHRAMVELLGLSGREVAELRSEAMWQNGSYQQAAQILAAAGDIDAAAHGFWLAGEWDAVPPQADAHYGQVVAGSVQLQKNDLGAIHLPPLAQARALMQGSSSARAGIFKLLQSVPVEQNSQ